MARRVRNDATFPFSFPLVRSSFFLIFVVRNDTAIRFAVPLRTKSADDSVSSLQTDLEPPSARTRTRMGYQIVCFENFTNMRSMMNESVQVSNNAANESAEITANQLVF